MNTTDKDLENRTYKWLRLLAAIFSVYLIFAISICLCPKLLFACIFHFAPTLRTGLHVPNTDIIAATLQAQAAHLASVRWCHVGDDTTNDNVLDGMAIRTKHGCNLLTKQSPSLIHLCLVATDFTAIFAFPGHAFILSLLMLQSLSQ